MFHKAINLEFKEGTVLEVTFRDGKVMSYDVKKLFKKYPQMKVLKERELFVSGALMGGYGIIWNDELDMEVETVYNDGKLIRAIEVGPGPIVGDAVAYARAERGLSQKELSQLTGIDQSDLSKIERGVANPSVKTLARIADALSAKLVIHMELED